MTYDLTCSTQLKLCVLGFGFFFCIFSRCVYVFSPIRHCCLKQYQVLDNSDESKLSAKGLPRATPQKIFPHLFWGKRGRLSGQSERVTIEPSF